MNLFRTFRSRNYRLFFIGQFTSLSGTWMSMMAIAWLVYRITGDEWMLGLIPFAMHVPTFLLSPLAGALVDRWNRRTVMVCAQLLDMVSMLVLAWLSLTGRVELWHVYATVALLGVAKGFDLPARQSLVVDIIDHRDDLPNAIALNSSMFQAARLIGPMLGAGVIWASGQPGVIAIFGEGQGEGICFLLDGLSYFAVISSLLALRLSAKPETHARKHLLHDMKEGFVHAFGFRPMRALMLLIGTIALLGIPYSSLLPVIADRVLRGNERTYSLLMSAGGLGAFLGALYLASRDTVLGLGKVIALSTILFGLSLAMFALSSWLWLSLLLLTLAGAASMVAMAGTNTIIQTLVEDATRGRVMSFFGMTFMGAMPLGSVIAGKLATYIGAPYTVLLGGLACVVAGLMFGWRLPVLRAIARPVYIERGILPQWSTGTQGVPGTGPASKPS